MLFRSAAGSPAALFFAIWRTKLFTNHGENGKLLSNYRLLDELSRKGWRITMKGYNHKRRMLFVRITAAVLAVLMVATVFTVLLLQ